MPMTLRPHKRIADSVHGSIELTELESQVIATPAFQRLRNIKQLGLAHYVFPNSDYSRFSHSLGGLPRRRTYVGSDSESLPIARDG